MKMKMKKLNEVKTMLFFPLIVFIAISCRGDAETIIKDFSIGPTSTFLRSDAYDSPSDPVIVHLEDNGITPGIRLIIKTVGNYINSPSGSTRNDAIGVFSASSQLLDKSELNRVVDAIDAGEERVTENTFQGNLITDIVEDFRIDDEPVKITVPAGAKFLFLGNADCKQSDNTQAPEGFKVEIEY